MLDIIASERLRTPSPWELAQWRTAAKPDRRGWEDAFDSARFCYSADDALRALDTELRRAKLWCGPMPASAAAAACPTELVRHEYSAARFLFSWPRADSCAIGGGKVLKIWDKVALYGTDAGVAAPNARSVDALHAFEQTSGTNQSPAPNVSALFNNQLVITNASGSLFYKSIIATSNWRFHARSHAIYTAARTTGGIACVVHSTANEIPSTRGIYYPLRQSASTSTNTATGRIMNGSGAYHANNNGDVGSAPLNVARVYAWKYTLNTSIAITSAIPKTVATVGSAVDLDATGGTMSLLGDGAFGGVGLIGDWAESMFWNRLPTAAEETMAARRFLLRYGLAI